MRAWELGGGSVCDWQLGPGAVGGQGGWRLSGTSSRDLLHRSAVASACTDAAVATPHPLWRKAGAVQESVAAVLTKLEAGVVSGVVQAGVFHPWDRALYLAQTRRTSFLNLANWRQPLQGIKQTLSLRVLSSSIFFPLEETVAPLAASALGGQGAMANFVAGNVAGGISAALLNPIQAIRYKAFSINAQAVEGKRINFFSTAKGMAARGGVRPFFKGIFPTVYRDLVFGGIYSVVRHSLYVRLERFMPSAQQEHARSSRSALQFACDVAGAALGTTVSSPFNYARNRIYALPSGATRRAGTTAFLSSLFLKAYRQPSPLASCIFLQHKLKIGAATLRVALSMALAASTYRAMAARQAPMPASPSTPQGNP
eukprot:Tamp_16055.p1 GENE.Tamp_16055~~Tamp_16055.p1  ORF type:complete len:417 (+),score=58.30 Tamp_16055:143-1252(+)